MISNPTNFNHVAHMGPGDGMQVLMDLPLVRSGLGGGGRPVQAAGSETQSRAHLGLCSPASHCHIDLEHLSCGHLLKLPSLAFFLSWASVCHLEPLTTPWVGIWAGGRPCCFHLIVP